MKRMLVAVVVIVISRGVIMAQGEQSFEERRIQEILAERIKSDRWQIVGVTVNAEKLSGMQYALDTSRIQKDDEKNVMRVWFRYDVYPDGETPDKGRYHYHVSIWRIDCTGFRFQQGPGTLYKRDGELAGSYNGWSAWADVLPDSLGEAMYNKTCAFIKRSDSAK